MPKRTGTPLARGKPTKRKRIAQIIAVVIVFLVVMALVFVYLVLPAMGWMA